MAKDKEETKDVPKSIVKGATDSGGDLWVTKTVEYRDEPAIAQAITSSKKFKIDLSLITELSGYFPHLDDGENAVKSIRGPSDLGVGLEVADRMLTTKDRASYIILVYENYKGKLERLHSIVHSHLLSKKELMALKNDAQRKSVVSITCPEIEDRLSRVNRVLDAAHRVVNNTNQSYNILKTQVEIIKEMMYEAGLSNATRKSSNLASDL